MDGRSDIGLRQPRADGAALAPSRGTARRRVAASEVAPRLASASVIPVVALLGGSLSAVWLSVRTGESTSRFSGVELPVLRYFLVALLATAVLGVLVEGMLLNRWPLAVPAIAGSALFVLAALMLLVEEVAASLIPTSFLPTAVRRLTVDVYGGVGIWTATIASLVLVVVSRIDGGTIGLLGRAWKGVERLPLRWLGAFMVAGLCVGVAAWSRYQPWATGSAGLERVEIPGWSLPFVGPASLVTVLALAAAAAVLTVHRSLIAALTLAASGWAMSFLAAIPLLAASTLARVEVERYLPAGVEQYGPSVQVRWGAWLMFATGCAAATSGFAIVHWLEREGR